LTLGGRSHRRSKGRRSIIVDDTISIDIEAKRRWLPNPNLILWKTTFIKTSTHRSGSPPLLTPVRLAGGEGTNPWWSRGQMAARSKRAAAVLSSDLFDMVAHSVKYTA
jgi:hypothetical protein